MNEAAMPDDSDPTPREPSAEPDPVDDVLAGYLRAVERGENPSQADLLARHPELADELREFFANHERMDRLARPICEPESAPAARDLPDRLRYFGDYQILEEIGRGGMGVVFKARQLTLNRVVAIKMILGGQLACSENVERFQNEAKAAARLDHPGIVPIFEVGQHEGQNYFSMGFVEGTSLSTRVAAGPLPPREAAEIVRAVAEAVQYAHDNGVIHRDLKAANILLDRQGKPRVTDFGLAKLAENASTLTGTGQVLGTPGYMPPEQAAAQVGAVGHLSDIYSLGAILYCLLTGRPPFQAATAIETLVQVQKQEPVAPRRVNPAVPLDLDTIVLKCLEKAPSRRFISARALGEELGRFLDGRPILVRRVSPLERLRRWCLREPLLSGLSAALLLALLTGTAASTFFAVKERSRANSEATARENEMRMRAAAQWQTERADTARNKAIHAEEEARGAKEEEHKARDSAERRRLEAEASTRLARRHLYIARMNLVQSAWADGRVDLVWDLLERHIPGPDEEDLRGFEWHYWHRLCRRDLPTHKHPIHWILSLAISPDGKRIASTSFDGTVVLWDAMTGQAVRTMKGAANHDNTIAFSPDGTCFAAGGEDSTVAIWDATTGERMRTIVGPTDKVTSVAFHPDGSLIATGSVDGQVRLWDAATGKEGTQFSQSQHQRALTGVAVSPDGSRIASWRDKTVTIWNVADGSVLHTLSGHRGEIHGVAFSPDGARVASGSEDETVRVWDLKAEDPAANPTVLRDYDWEVLSVGFSPDGASIASGSDDGRVRIWDAHSGKLIRSLNGHVGAASCVAFTPDGCRIASGGHDGKLLVRDIVPREESVRFAGSRGDGRPLMVSDDGIPVMGAAVTVNAYFKTVNVDRSSRGSQILISPDKSRRISLSRDENSLWADAAIVHLFDVVTDQELLTTPRQIVAGFSPDGNRLVTASDDGTIRFWDSVTGQEILTLHGKTDVVWSIAFSPDGTRFATGNEDGSARVWDAPHITD